MRILLVLKKFDFGGTENHVCDLANNFTKFGHQVFILAERGRQLERVDYRVQFISYRLRDHFFPINIFYIAYLIRKFKIDIVHAHQRIAILYCAYAKKFINFPFIVTVHGRTDYDLRSKLSRKAPDKVIFVSNHIYKKILANKILATKSVDIPNGVEISFGKKESIPFSISYISRIDGNHSKLILMIINKVLPLLLTDNKNITLNVIGDGDGLKQVRIEAEKLNSQMNRQVCHISGFQPEVNDYIYKSSVVLGVGRVALESIACGTPVLSINRKRLGSIVTTQNYSAYKRSNFVNTEGEEPKAEIVYSILTDFFKDIQKYNLETKEVQGMIGKDFDIESLSRSIENHYFELEQLYAKK